MMTSCLRARTPEALERVWGQRGGGVRHFDCPKADPRMQRGSHLGVCVAHLPMEAAAVFQHRGAGLIQQA